MKINIDIDESHEETQITIQAKEWTKELEEIVNIVKKTKQQRLFGMDEDQTVLLAPREIDFIHAEKRKIYAVSKNWRFEVKMKLYEVEEFLIPHGFMRFSKSVIGNIHRIEKFEASFNGNLCVYFQSGNKEYITRTYVGAIKDKLMQGGQ
ncbi:LytTR family DNA-binding domain-containing protein [Gracilibacillus alcaliphilus]|uniref:LytTR family DNA-binding domain-containing protein n=1 Tax=Gracilibacillus alcaliphilus TaxID=1401441 RepID=UPI00195A7C1B|nr:LytTR family DNA-binding domain-containing protein [Gracilibacillus alcaliphilus]MBM7675783.1 DNA-binding LytR/AlgR family response regulator [Gracilibacillus alcaliphilus]